MSTMHMHPRDLTQGCFAEAFALFGLDRSWWLRVLVLIFIFDPRSARSADANTSVKHLSLRSFRALKEK